MAKRGVRKKDDERLDDVTVGRVVSLLEGENPITKKAACEELNISYNTSRLAKIIQEYKDNIEFRKKRFAANKNLPFSDAEIQDLVTSYLNGESVASISEALFRSVHKIKRKITDLHLPERTKKPTYWEPDLIPDEAVSSEFKAGELVWAARYNSVAEIMDRDYPEGNEVYAIFVFGKHNEFAYQPWWELGKLDIVKQLNIPAEKFIKTEKPNFAYRVDDYGQTIR